MGRILHPDYEMEIGGWIEVNGGVWQITQADLKGGFVLLYLTDGWQRVMLPIRPQNFQLLDGMLSSVLVIRNPNCA